MKPSHTFKRRSASGRTTRQARTDLGNALSKLPGPRRRSHRPVPGGRTTLPASPIPHNDLGKRAVESRARAGRHRRVSGGAPHQARLRRSPRQPGQSPRSNTGPPGGGHRAVSSRAPGAARPGRSPRQPGTGAGGQSRPPVGGRRAISNRTPPPPRPRRSPPRPRPRIIRHAGTYARSRRAVRSRPAHRSGPRRGPLRSRPGAIRHRPPGRSAFPI